MSPHKNFNNTLFLVITFIFLLLVFLISIIDDTSSRSLAISKSLNTLENQPYLPPLPKSRYASSGIPADSLPTPHPVEDYTGMQAYPISYVFKPSDPYIAGSIGTYPDVSPDVYAKKAKLVIIGVVKTLGQPKWSTKDGRRPENPFDDQNFIYTPVTIKVDRVIKGSTLSGEIIVNVSGGRIGEDILTLEPKNMFSFKLDDKVVLFLQDGAPYLNGEIHNFLDRYTIISDGLATNEFRSMPLEELVKYISSVQ